MRQVGRCIITIIIGTLLFQCKRDDPDLLVNITDSNFLNALIAAGIDTNGDGKISIEEAEAVTYINVAECDIQDLSGIEKFINLEELWCNNNPLESLDLSKNPFLKFVKCSRTSITSLDLSNHEYLNELICYHSDLINLDVSNATSLEFLRCWDCNLTGLDISNCTALGLLWCQDNNLSALDASNKTALYWLICSNNQLTSLDVSGDAVLALSCSGNQLTSLDVSSNIDIKELDLNDMPSLGKVCVWEVPFPPEGIEIDTTGSPNMYFTADCSK